MRASIDLIRTARGPPRTMRWLPAHLHAQTKLRHLCQFCQNNFTKSRWSRNKSVHLLPKQHKPNMRPHIQDMQDDLRAQGLRTKDNRITSIKTSQPDLAPALLTNHHHIEALKVNKILILALLWQIFVKNFIDGKSFFISFAIILPRWSQFK